MDTSVEAFHANHLAIWKCSNCPVCYLIKNPSFLNDLVCMKCGVKRSLWICLTCGHVGCSRNVKRHTFEHYKETNHRQVMSVERLLVYDYKLGKHLHHDKEQKNHVSPTSSPKSSKINCSCPVCQNEATPRFLKLPTCMKCKHNRPENLWICSSCGYVGCGVLNSNHILLHYQTTHHAKIVKMQNFSTYDYAQRKYLHKTVGAKEVIKSGNDEIDSLDDRKESDVATTNECTPEKVNTTSNIKIDSVGTGELSAAFTMLQQQYQYVLNRVELFEMQREEKLQDTIKKVTTLEQVMVNLTGEVNALIENPDTDEEMLTEVFKKVSRILDNNLPVVTSETDKVEILNEGDVRSTEINVLPISMERPAVAIKFNERQFLFIIALGLFGVGVTQFFLNCFFNLCYSVILFFFNL